MISYLTHIPATSFQHTFLSKTKTALGSPDCLRIPFYRQQVKAKESQCLSDSHPETFHSGKYNPPDSPSPHGHP